MVFSEQQNCFILMRIVVALGRYFLKKARDPQKDQSYVLYTLTQEQLAHLLFPLGELTKPQARALARENGFWNAEKSESQDICFVPNGDYAGTVEAVSGQKSCPGDFISLDGRILGRHRGIVHYTVGQRRGLGIAKGQPLYVRTIDPEANTVTLCSRHELLTRETIVRQANWISGVPPVSPFRCCARLRYRQTEQPCTVTPERENSFRIVFDAPQIIGARGQAAVLYDGDNVLGGGIITQKTEEAT